jgi:hypothetical protein
VLKPDRPDGLVQMLNRHNVSLHENQPTSTMKRLWQCDREDLTSPVFVYFRTNFFAELDPNLRQACETCLERCQKEAKPLVDDIARVDQDRYLLSRSCIILHVCFLFREMVI